MSPFERPRFYAASPKQPAPAHGIRMNKAGTTWWGQRWLEALEHVLRGDSGRLSRGRTYARAGRTHDLEIIAGKVSARVTGSRVTPYEVRIELAQLPDSTWDLAIAGMAQKAQFSAELLAGTMPERIDEVFRPAKSSLFPQHRQELVTSCSCPDSGDPCKHVAATHYLLGEALDRDPFLLFELRGRTKAQVLAALRAARDASEQREPALAAGGEPSSAADPSGEVPRVALGKLRPADYDKAREPLPALSFSFDAPLIHGAVLKQLGVPAAWRGQGSPFDALAPLVSRAAEAARRLALADSEPSAAAESPPSRSQRPSPPPRPAEKPSPRKRAKRAAASTSAKASAKRRPR
jgi:uncharacterized Zn finger protein